MEVVHRVADIKVGTQVLTTLAILFLGPLLLAFSGATSPPFINRALFLLVSLLLVAPNIARIYREAQCERQWFYSRTVAFNLWGVFFLVVLVPSVFLLATEDGVLQQVMAFLPVGVLLVALVSLVGYAFLSGRRAWDRWRAKRQLNAALQQKLADGILCDADKQELERLVEDLGLSSSDFDAERQRKFDIAISPLLKTVRSARRLSPEQEQEIIRVARAHQVNARIGTELQTFRQLWQIEKTGRINLAPLDVLNVRLGRGEECYLAIPAQWRQLKKKRENAGYVGASVGVRLAKGVTLRVGKAVPVYRETEQLEVISDGVLYVTSKKLLFVGSKRSTNITFGRLVGCELARNAVQINKSSGRPDVFFMRTEHVELLDAHLQVL